MRDNSTNFRGLTTGIPEACCALGISVTLGRGLAREGRFPVPVRHVGRRWLVPIAPLAADLGLTPDEMVAWLKDLPAEQEGA